MDWDRVGHEATLAATDRQIADLERTAAWLRELLEPAEREHAAYHQARKRVNQKIFDVYQRTAGRTATEREQAELQALEGEEQRLDQRYKDWTWAEEVIVEDRSRVGNPRRWSWRWPDDVRSRLVTVTAGLEKALASRETIVAGLAAQDDVDQPRTASWPQRLLGGRS